MSALIVLFLLCSFSPEASGANINELLDKMDYLYRSDTSFSKIEMQIATPNWKRTLDMDIWTKGMDYTFVVITSPKKDKGISTLKRENEMWNFFPKINKVMKVPPSMMMSSWMGSDFTNDDLVKENTLRQDYHAKFGNGDQVLYEIILTPKKSTVSLWGKIELYIDKKTTTPVREIFYDEKNIKIRTMEFKDLKKMGNRLIPAVMELIPHTEEKKGHITIIKYKNIDFNIPVKNSVFSRRNLQKRRQ